MKNYSEIAILYLSKHFRRKITLKELANKAAISPYHFHRLFMEENKVTPQEYLENIRMQHASHIISAFPKWSMIDIAFECGYSSPGIFSRAFKKYFGVPPSKYIPKGVIKPTSLKSKEPLNIQYLSKKVIDVRKVSLENKKLNAAYNKLKQSEELNKVVYGFFLDAPFHVPIEKCRYYMGVESSSKEKYTTLTFPAGYYTYITIEEGFEKVKEEVVEMNDRIQKAGYCMDSLIGYEIIKISNNSEPFDYMTSARDIFMKVRRE